ncbi:MAG: thiamine diphosphokinase [Firmicutes bacterium HGW-Firmicutes-15]|nr:MAG: thiamine diphosphokinase [Firmicutes bacterium HGW-Firmicutes-15]
MRCIILANGEYGDMEAYQSLFQDDDTVLCADGGANYAYMLGVMPDSIIGDMDSILPEVREFFEARNVEIQKFPRHKDFTDTQLALDIAQEWGATEILMLGTLGRRLDHTLSNLYCGIELVQRGIKLTHFTPEYWVYIINQDIEIEGKQGDTVSVLALTQEARGVSEIGFEYPLENTVLEKSNPYAISNRLASSKGKIRVQEGILAVIHYLQKLEGDSQNLA